MFKTRLISGIVLLAGLITLIIIGGLPLWIASLIVACLGIYELYKVCGIHNDRITWVSYPVTAAYFLFVSRFKNAAAIIMGIVIIILTIYVIAFPRIRFSKYKVIPLAVLYPGLLSGALYLTRSSISGLYFASIILITSWGSDTAAYCTGMLIGKTHPFPQLSPKKTIAGCIGGVIGGSLLCAVLALIMKESVIAAISIGIVGSVFSEIGDLCASAFKRQYDVKDYGSLIPGHGGIMDRFDSMMFTGAIVFICVTFLY